MHSQYVNGVTHAGAVPDKCKFVRTFILFCALYCSNGRITRHLQGLSCFSRTLNFSLRRKGCDMQRIALQHHATSQRWRLT
jgi:hypothetical protein